MKHPSFSPTCYATEDNKLIDPCYLGYHSIDESVTLVIELFRIKKSGAIFIAKTISKTADNNLRNKLQHLHSEELNASRILKNWLKGYTKPANLQFDFYKEELFEENNKYILDVFYKKQIIFETFIRNFIPVCPDKKLAAYLNKLLVLHENLKSNLWMDNA